MAKPPSSRKKDTSAASSDSTLPDDLAEEENPALATITVTAVEVPELTEEEQRDRLHLERKVERAFFEAGKALAELRDRRLYRSSHRTFEEYCRDRFGHSRRQSYLLIDAAVVFDNLVEICDLIVIYTSTSTTFIRQAFDVVCSLHNVFLVIADSGVVNNLKSIHVQAYFQRIWLGHSAHKR